MITKASSFFLSEKITNPRDQGELLFFTGAFKAGTVALIQIGALLLSGDEHSRATIFFRPPHVRLNTADIFLSKRQAGNSFYMADDCFRLTSGYCSIDVIVLA